MDMARLHASAYRGKDYPFRFNYFARGIGMPAWWKKFFTAGESDEVVVWMRSCFASLCTLAASCCVATA